MDTNHEQVEHERFTFRVNHTGIGSMLVSNVGIGMYSYRRPANDDPRPQAGMALPLRTRRRLAGRHH